MTTYTNHTSDTIIDIERMMIDHEKLSPAKEVLIHHIEHNNCKALMDNFKKVEVNTLHNFGIPVLERDYIPEGEAWLYDKENYIIIKIKKK